MDLNHERNRNFSLCTDDLALLCQIFITPKHKKVNRFINGLTIPMREIVTTLNPDNYDHVNRLEITLTKQWVLRRSWSRNRMPRKLSITKGNTRVLLKEPQDKLLYINEKPRKFMPHQPLHKNNMTIRNRCETMQWSPHRWMLLLQQVQQKEAQYQLL